MNPKTKMLTNGILGGAMLVLIVAVALPLSAAYPEYANETSRKLEHDVPVLDTANITVDDLTVKYTYENDDGDQFTKEIAAAKLDVGADLDANELRMVSVDLSGITFDAAKVPDYSDTADFDHFVTIEFPEEAGILFDETVAHLCYGLTLIRGFTPAGNSTDVDVQDYKVEVGAGTSVLKSFTLTDAEDDGVDEDTGDANTNQVGECLDREDESDDTAAFAEFGEDIGYVSVARFLTAVGDDTETLWIKVYGPRAQVTGTEEDGDTFDVLFQAYTYDVEKRAAYANAGWLLLIGGGIAALAAIVMTTFVNLDGNILKGASKPKDRPAFVREA